MAEILFDIELKPYKLIDLHLTGKGISNTWVARYLDVTPAYICLIRSGKVALTEKMREKINELLETNY